MNLTNISHWLALVARLVGQISGYLYMAIMLTVIVFLALYWIIEKLRLNPFGKIVYYLRRPGSLMLHKMQRSPFHYPLRRALKFDPSGLMVLGGTAIFCYLIAFIIDNFVMLLSGLSMTLLAFGDSQIFAGAWKLTGLVLLGVIFYLMALMTVIFINWLFGWFQRPAHWSLQKLNPLLRLFEFGGAGAGFSFLLLSLALSLAAQAVARIFLASQ
jgi:hypothetical protein